MQPSCSMAQGHACFHNHTWPQATFLSASVKNIIILMCRRLIIKNNWWVYVMANLHKHSLKHGRVVKHT